MGFTQAAKVLMADGTRKFVPTLKKGDVVEGGYRVVCVVRTPVEQKILMTSLSGLCVSQWHPLQIGDEWVFPRKLEEGVNGTRHVEVLYNVILDSGHILRIGEYNVCTLGHGLTDDMVIEHPYFGTNAVVGDLKKLPGWSSGNVELPYGSEIRDIDTGIVRGLGLTRTDI